MSNKSFDDCVAEGVRISGIERARKKIRRSDGFWPLMPDGCVCTFCQYNDSGPDIVLPEATWNW
eukprot:5985465-Lingulodinium_polyedra.AAC.1